MKKILLSIIVLAVAAFTANLKAQCSLQFSNLVIQPVSAVPDGGKCKVTFNASFDISTNSGFKYLFFHSWLAADYPNPPIFSVCSGNQPAVNPGTSAELGTAVDDPGMSFLDAGFINLKDITDTLTIGIPVNVTANIATTYPHDNTVVLTKPSNSPGLTAIMTKTSANILHFDVTNILVILNQPCGSPVVVKTDIWGSNSNAPDPKAQCYICGNNQNFGDPDITGFKICSNPRTYTLGITTVDPVAKDITYKVFIDMNNNGTLQFGTDELAFTSGTISISSSSPYTTGGPVALPPPYSTSQPYGDKGYLILVEGPTLANSILEYFPDPACGPLPVKFVSFTARRTSSSNVNICFQTATEINNSGFEIQRNINGVWETVEFIPSQAPGGNSTELLTYCFNDMNSAKGISQYRIIQIDFDGTKAYSEIRAVRGDGQRGKTIVYPNPSSDGKVNIVFEDINATRDVILIDMTGRTISSWRNVSNNNLQIENLVPGVYTLKIYVAATGDFSAERIVVNKR